jgi:TPP-dependent pyruvate/acetoin dehydrogenase alpha subunit
MKKVISEIRKNIIKSRELQLEIAAKMSKNLIATPVHLGLGHELISAIVYQNFDKKKDKLVLTHRNIHYTSLFCKNFKYKYLDLQKKMISKKKTKGSMNFSDKKSGIIYTSSILGNNLSVATGIAMALKNKSSVCICVTGDGAIEEGSFYESLLFSKYLKLPLIFLVENNNWSMATSIPERRTNINLRELSNSLKIEYKHFDSSSLKKNNLTFRNVVKKTRKINSPIICEMEVFTLGFPHKNGLSDKYHHGAIKSKIVKNLFIDPIKKDVLYNTNQKLKKKFR